MAFFGVSCRIDAPVERVWSLLLDWEGSSAWMVDATTVEVTSAQREGVGTWIKAVTRIGGVRLTDVMEVTAWEPMRLIQVRHHRAPIKGTAWFEIGSDGDGTFFGWAEELQPPLGPLGELGGRILRTPIERMLERSMRTFKAIAER